MSQRPIRYSDYDVRQSHAEDAMLVDIIRSLKSGGFWNAATNLIIDNIAREVSDHLSHMRYLEAYFVKHNQPRIDETMKITAEMIQEARKAVFEYSHPGKKTTDVAWEAPSVGLIKAILEAGLNASNKSGMENGD